MPVPSLEEGGFAPNEEGPVELLLPVFGFGPVLQRDLLLQRVRTAVEFVLQLRYAVLFGLFLYLLYLAFVNLIENYHELLEQGGVGGQQLEHPQTPQVVAEGLEKFRALADFLIQQYLVQLALPKLVLQSLFDPYVDLGLGHVIHQRSDQDPLNQKIIVGNPEQLLA